MLLSSAVWHKPSKVDQGGSNKRQHPYFMISEIREEGAQEHLIIVLTLVDPSPDQHYYPQLARLRALIWGVVAGDETEDQLGST